MYLLLFQSLIIFINKTFPDVLLTTSKSSGRKGKQNLSNNFLSHIASLENLQNRCSVKTINSAELIFFIALNAMKNMYHII